MARNVSQQTLPAPTEKARDEALKKLETMGATIIRIDEVSAQRRRRHKLISLPKTFLIRYYPAVTPVNAQQPKRRRPGPWLKPTPFYPQSKHIQAPGV